MSFACALSRSLAFSLTRSLARSPALSLERSPLRARTLKRARARAHTHTHTCACTRMHTLKTVVCLCQFWGFCKLSPWVVCACVCVRVCVCIHVHMDTSCMLYTHVYTSVWCVLLPVHVFPFVCVCVYHVRMHACIRTRRPTGPAHVRVHGTGRLQRTWLLDTSFASARTRSRGVLTSQTNFELDGVAGQKNDH